MGQRKTVAIYSRKSKFTGKGESIENQIEMCKKHIAMYIGAVDVLVYEDEGFSGGNLQRPQFKKMMADGKAGQFSSIVVYRLDRISRNISDFSVLIQELEQLKIDFVSIKEQFDTSSPMGRAMMYISSVFSQLERETIAERIRDNMMELAKTGRWLGGITPTGYKSEKINAIRVDGKEHSMFCLEQIPEEIALVETIYKVFLETNSLTKTDGYLLQNGYQTKNGKPFTRFSIRNILTNPVYMQADAEAYQYFSSHGADLYSDATVFDGATGVMAYNRTEQVAGRSNQIRPMEEWIVAAGKHTGVIPGATWVKVQELLSQNSSKSFRKPRSNVALLSGVLVCGHCGEPMRPKLTKRENDAGEKVYSYLCETKERSRGQCCRMKNAPGNGLDEALVNQIKMLGEDSSAFIQSLEENQHSLIEQNEAYQKEVTQVRSTMGENKTSIAQLVQVLAKGANAETQMYVEQEIQTLHDQNHQLSQRLAELQAFGAQQIMGEDGLEVMAALLQSFATTMDTMDVEEKRAAIRMLVHQVIWDGKQAHVVLFGSDLEWTYQGEKTPLGEDSK